MQTFSRLDNTLKAYNIHLYIHTATLITIIYIYINKRNISDDNNERMSNNGNETCSLIIIHMFGADHDQLVFVIIIE